MYAVPVYHAGELVGVLAASDTLDIFTDIANGKSVMGGAGYVHLINDKGDILVRSENTLVQEEVQNIYDGTILTLSLIHILDADSVLQYDSLEKIVRPVLEDSNVVAVGGVVRPCNGAEIHNGRVVSYRMPNKIIPCMQVLEYDRSFLAARILFDKFNGSIIISGAFGLFKKSVVIDAGGYDPTTMGEDMELVVKLHAYCRENRIPYRIRYATNAICWTQAPEKLGDLCKQRRRWHIGLSLIHIYLSAV